MEKKLIYTALCKIGERLEACGASQALTYAESLVSDLRMAIGNEFNPPDNNALERVVGAISGFDVLIDNCIYPFAKKQINSIDIIGLCGATDDVQIFQKIVGRPDKLIKAGDAIELKNNVFENRFYTQSFESTGGQ